MNHMNMNGMSVGNGTAGGMPPMNNGTNGATPRAGNGQEPQTEYKIRLNTFIYDYFLKIEQYDCARQLLNSSLTLTTRNNRSPGRRPNGINDSSMEADSKEDIDSKRPQDLPAPDIGDMNENTSFLLEWFSLFQDMFLAQRKDKLASAQALHYMQHTQQASRLRQDQQNQYMRQPAMMPGNLGYQSLMRMHQNGMQMNPNELRARAASQNNLRNVNPQMMRQQQYLQQQQMERGGSDVDINGQRPRTPSSGDNAPSPSKKPRLEGPSFRGQQMMPNAQGNAMLINGGIQPDYLSPAQLDKFNSQPPHVQQKSIATYNDHMAQQHRQTMSQGGMLNQGSPMMHGAMDVGAAGINDFYNAGPQAMRIAQQNANGTAGNHALQDYQMQLMLLEQQNKKRLMMARQEQNNLHPDGQPMAGQGFPTGMSPQGSRSGPSPNPSDQMKRGTPKMGPAGLPMSGSPMPEGAMPPGRGSPGPMNLNGGQIPPEMFQQAMKGMGEGMAVGPNGVMRPPPSSHPQFANGLTQQQVEAMRAQAAQNGGRMPNGVNWPQGPQGQAPMIPQPSQPQQAVGTPQQRTAMPPPQGLPAAGAANGRPSPPSQAANPPTPQQSTKANPKPKKDAKDRKRPQKKGSVATAATPSSEAENPPPTPTPQTPITPVHPNSFKEAKNNTNGQMQGTNGQASTSAPVPTAVAQPQSETNLIQQFNPNIDGMEPTLNMDFASMDTGDIMDGFNFDSFIQEHVDTDFDLDATMGFGTFDGVEASAGDA